MLIRVLLLGLGFVVVVSALTAAIIAAAPAIAVAIVVASVVAVLWWTDFPSDKQKPPQ